MHRFNTAVFAVLCLIGAVGMARGQGAVGTLTGTVTDASGALVPGATVTVTNQATGAEKKTTTTSAGAYTLPYLTAGTYIVRVSATRFRTAEAMNLVLRVAQTLSLNVTLQVGQLNEEVIVRDTPELLEAGSAEIGRYISTEEYKSWPILIDDGQRQIQSFIFDSLPGATGGTFQGSINGGQQYSHEILIEGIPVGRADLMGGNNNEFSPSAEAIGEFKLQTGAVSAEYNGGQTAVANFSIKSGTNRLHGSAFYYMQNEALDAKSLADKTQGNPKAHHRENNEGYSLGGPVLIPRIYNGKNKTFFFTNFEKDHLNDLSFAGFSTLATPDFKHGDFSRLLDPGFTGNPDSGTEIGADALGRPVIFGQIYDPRSTRRLPNGAVVRDPFPGNMIPESLWDPVSKNIETLGLTDPTFDRMVRNIVRLGNAAPLFDLHIIGVKGDHNISDKHHLSAFYNQSYRFRWCCGKFLPIPGPPTSSWLEQFTPGRMARMSLSSVLSQTVLNRVAAGFNRFFNQAGAPVATLNEDWAGRIGMSNTAPTAFPFFQFNGEEYQGRSIASIGAPGLLVQANGSWAVNDDLTWIRGAHSFHFGYAYTRYYFNERNYSSSGHFAFSPRATDLPGFLDQTGHAFASFLLGAVDNASRYVSTLSDGFRQPYHALYAKDDWKITPRLTVNAGLRWEIIPPFYERTGRLSYIDLNAPNPDADNRPGALVFRNRPSRTYWREFGPRLGFAYQAASRIVLRGGYAMMNTPPIRNDFSYGGFTFGYSGTINVQPGTSPTGFPDDPPMYLSQRFPDLPGSLPDTSPGAGNWNAYQTTAPDANRPGYTQNWDFSLQYQPATSTVLELAYIGNKGTRVWGGSSVFGELNGVPARLLAMGDILLDPVSMHPEFKPFAKFPDNYTVAQALRPYPQYFSIQEAFPYDSGSDYNSMQVTVTRHLTAGLGFLAAYTWSKTISYVDSNGAGGSLGYPGVQVQDYYNRRLERSITTFNYPHSFKLTWVYETPFGKGRHWHLGKLDYVLGGWQLAAIHNYHSGDPISVNEAGLNTPDGFSWTVRPDVVLGQKLTLGGAPAKVDFLNPTPYLNPAAFAPTPMTGNGVPLRVGTAPRVIDRLRGPHSLDERFRMSKRFPIRERANVGVGMTMSNPFNRTSPYLVSTTVGDSSFGQLLQGGGGRTIQLDARIEF